MNISNFKIPNNKEITMFLEKFAQNSMNLCEEKINLLKKISNMIMRNWSLAM